MTAGTRSILYGVHQFAIHPFVVALGWYRAFGLDATPMFPGDGARIVYSTSIFDPRLWLAFALHDIGLFGKPDMDGPIGETHPEVGGRVMGALFGKAWGDFCLLHSRYYSKRLGRPVSALCIADKWAIVVEPSWLYLPRAWASGELREYLANAKKRAAGDPTHLNSGEYTAFLAGNPWGWHRSIKSYMRRWLAEHADGKPDTWTKVRHGAAAADSL